MKKWFYTFMAAAGCAACLTTLPASAEKDCGNCAKQVQCRQAAPQAGHHGKHQASKNHCEMLLQRMTEKLALTADQQSKIKPILEQHDKAMQGRHQAAKSDFESVLTAEQKAQFAKVKDNQPCEKIKLSEAQKAKLKAMRQARMAERKSAMDKLKAQIKPILSADQQSKLDSCFKAPKHHRGDKRMGHRGDKRMGHCGDKAKGCRADKATAACGNEATCAKQAANCGAKACQGKADCQSGQCQDGKCKKADKHPANCRNKEGRPHPAAMRGPGPVVPPQSVKMLQCLNAKLDLTLEQQEKVTPLLQDFEKTMKQRHESRRSEDQKLHEALQSQIKAVLTPEQQAKFAKFHEEMKQGPQGRHPGCGSGCEGSMPPPPPCPAE